MAGNPLSVACARENGASDIDERKAGWGAEKNIFKNSGTLENLDPEGELD